MVGWSVKSNLKTLNESLIFFNLEVVRHCATCEGHMNIFFISQDAVIDASVKTFCSLSWTKRNRIEALQHCKVIWTIIREGDLEQWNSER